MPTIRIASATGPARVLYRSAPLPSAHFPLGVLAGELFDNGRTIRLMRPFAFIDRATGFEVLIPAGFSSDYNSTPRLLWSVFPPWKHPEAGVVHDYLYRNGGAVGSPSQRIYTRGESDSAHRRILELTGARRLIRRAAYRALRLFGASRWQAQPQGDA